MFCRLIIKPVSSVSIQVRHLMKEEFILTKIYMIVSVHRFSEISLPFIGSNITHNQHQRIFLIILYICYLVILIQTVIFSSDTWMVVDMWYLLKQIYTNIMKFTTKIPVVSAITIVSGNSLLWVNYKMKMIEIIFNEI